MTSKEKQVIEEMIEKLDGAAGRLIVTATKVPEVKDAMEMVSKVSFDLENLL
jgi:hypothetical protein